MVFNFSCLGFFILWMALITTFALGFSSKTLPTSLFNESFFPLYGNDHVIFLDPEGKSVQISLDQNSGSGFISQDMYLYSYFSASIKLPADYTAGVVVSYYTSNSDEYQNNHDELDFEFLGNVRGQPWLVQTNIYGNGSTARGREERYNLWFDPTLDFHTYSILWTSKWIVFYVDQVPIRVVQKIDAMGGDYPSKAMTLYATIWDGSAWATSGGKHKVNYRFAPYIAKYSNFVLYGCSVDPTREALGVEKCGNSTDLDTFNGLTSKEESQMEKFRKENLIYSYCNDRSRYPTPLPECNVKGNSS